MRIPQAGDYIKTIDDWAVRPWKGKVRRVSNCMALIEWSYTGGLPTDICTWVFLKELHITKRFKVSEERHLD